MSNLVKNRRSPTIKTENEIELIEQACRVVADTLSLVSKYAKPGIETIELDRIAEDFIKSNNSEPAFKGYKVEDRLFPYTLCISIDDEVVHGFPKQRKLIEGDLVSIDCGVKKKGYYGDSAVTIAIGNVSEQKKKLLEVTESALMTGLKQAVTRNKVYDISKAIQEFVESNGFSVTRELVGHGIGKRLHEEPAIPNFIPPLLHRNSFPNEKLFKNMTLAIEPMVQAGDFKVKTAPDGWTVFTADGKPAAHFEHTVVVDDGKPIILTLRN